MWVKKESRPDSGRLSYFFRFGLEPRPQEAMSHIVLVDVVPRDCPVRCDACWQRALPSSGSRARGVKLRDCAVISAQEAVPHVVLI